MIKSVCLMMIAVTAATAGDVLLARGMKELGDLSVLAPKDIAAVAVRAVTAPKLVIGTMLLSVFYFLWLAVLSWEDLSVAMPLQALNFIVVAFCSHWILGEVVTPERWFGTALIYAGVVVVARSGTV